MGHLGLVCSGVSGSCQQISPIERAVGKVVCASSFLIKAMGMMEGCGRDRRKTSMGTLVFSGLAQEALVCEDAYVF